MIVQTQINSLRETTVIQKEEIENLTLEHNTMQSNSAEQVTHLSTELKAAQQQLTAQEENSQQFKMSTRKQAADVQKAFLNLLLNDTVQANKDQESITTEKEKKEKHWNTLAKEYQQKEEQLLVTIEEKDQKSQKNQVASTIEHQSQVAEVRF